MKPTKTLLNGIVALLLSLTIMSCKDETVNKLSAEHLALEKAER